MRWGGDQSFLRDMAFLWGVGWQKFFSPEFVSLAQHRRTLQNPKKVFVRVKFVFFCRFHFAIPFLSQPFLRAEKNVCSPWAAANFLSAYYAPKNRLCQEKISKSWLHAAYPVLETVGAVPANSICGLFIRADSAGRFRGFVRSRTPAFQSDILGII